MSLTIKNLCKFAVLGTCFMFLAEHSLAEEIPLYVQLMNKVRNSVLEKYSTSYTIDEALSKLKCKREKRRESWGWVSTDKVVIFNCNPTEDTEALNKFYKGENEVTYAVTFYTTNGQISDIGANVWITLPDGAKVSLRDGLKLGRDELLAAVFNPAEKGRIFPLSDFIKFRSQGRYTDLIDFVEKKNPIHIVQNGFLKEFSTTTTVGETMNRLKCENKKWEYEHKKSGKIVRFSCAQLQDIEYLDKSRKGRGYVGLSAAFRMLDEGFEAKSCDVSIIREEPQAYIYMTLQKSLKLNADDLWPTIFSTAEKDSIFPLNDFIKTHLNGRYSDISDFVEKEKNNAVYFKDLSTP